MNLKIAGPEDFNIIYEMCIRFGSNSPYKEYIDKDKIAHAIQSYLESDKTRHIIILAFSHDKPIGCMIAAIAETVFSKETLAHEIIFWVEPEHRGSRAAFELVNAFEFWAKKMGARFTQLGVVNTPIQNQIEKFYLKRGYSPIEKGYIKDLT